MLPFGLRVLQKIEAIVREEMNKTGAQELLMTNLQDKEHWETTGRWKLSYTDDSMFPQRPPAGPRSPQ
jgi:prolyl-tRNA synthetase